MDLLELALEQARLGLGRTSPNPAVGAVVANPMATHTPGGSA